MQRNFKTPILKAARRIVVKLGPSVVTTDGDVDRTRIGLLTAELSRFHDEGRQIIVVTSGARAAGLGRMNLRSIPTRIPEQQAAAAIGQIRLMAIYEECFARFGRHIGQVLVSAADIRDKTRYLHAKNTFENLLSLRIVPVVNENDSVSIDELKFGDNDRLAALVAALTDADLLIILTDVDGVYDRDPRHAGARLMPLIDEADSKAVISEVSSRQHGRVGTGGIESKLEAVRYAARCGIASVIANGRRDGILTSIFDRESLVGTLFKPSPSPVGRRKHWIAFGAPVKGRLVVDQGAREALIHHGGSLLPKGITAVRGTFGVGDRVACYGPDGDEFARGLAAYDSSDCERIRGRKSDAIEPTLGYSIGDEVIHRDDLVLLDTGTPTVSGSG